MLTLEKPLAPKFTPRQDPHVGAIEAALINSAKGNVVPHEEAVKRINAAIAKAKSKHKQ